MTVVSPGSRQHYQAPVGKQLGARVDAVGGVDQEAKTAANQAGPEVEGMKEDVDVLKQDIQMLD